MLYILKIMFYKVRTSYAYFRNTDLDAFAKSVVNSLSGNDNFPTAKDLVDTLSESQIAFHNACIAAVSRDRNKIAERNTLRTTLLENLRALATLINSLSLGNKEKLVSSGFVLIEPEHHTTMDAPKDFKVVNGVIPGSLIASAAKPASSTLMILQYTADPIDDSKPVVWVDNYSSTSKFELLDLPANARLNFRMKALGTRGKVSFSNIINRSTNGNS